MKKSDAQHLGRIVAASGKDKDGGGAMRSELPGKEYEGTSCDDYNVLFDMGLDKPIYVYVKTQ